VAGTQLSTDHGDKAVEDLRAGDRVQTKIYGAVQTVVWIGHRRVDCMRHPSPQKVWPVRIVAHAFGEGRPGRDLWLSPDHSIYVNGSLIPVKYLINGTTIVQIPVAEVTYYHVELGRHDVVLSEGLFTESYLDTGDRGNFVNGGTTTILHPDFSEPLYDDWTSLVWEARGCAPLVVTGDEVVAVQRLLAVTAENLRARSEQTKPRRGPRRRRGVGAD
jgi:hypothetical protein